MVVCKYFQQGTCRFGQYCKFEHINAFGTNAVNRNKAFTADKSIALSVAEDALIAERGSQWLLSCYGPFDGWPCIPGMEDLSQEEVRWEMYQAKKNGTVDQISLQFQQLCQAMKAKKDVLKNPTNETLAMLEKLQRPDMSKSNFAFATPQLGNTTASSSSFAQKPFGTTNNPFGGGFNANTSSTSSIFGRSSNATGASVFGGKPTFGSNNVFATGSTTNTSVFGGPQNAPTFGGLATQSPTVFGGTTSQSTFGQPATFSSAAQASSPFSKPQTGQTSVFGGSTGFGETQAASNVFGGAAATNSVFGGTAAASGNTGFGQPQQATFGNASVFGATTFGAAPNTSVFGGQSNFGNSTVPTGNVFGTTNAAATTFGSLTQGNSFTAPPNATPFGTVVTTSTTPFGVNNAPFGTTTNVTTFSTQSGPFSFAAAGKDTTSTFGNTVVTTTAQGSVFSTSSAPFSTPVFGANTAFTSASGIATTTTTANPFMTNAQTTNSVFGAQPQASLGVFGKSPVGVSVTLVIDDSAYSAEESLTDDEKNAYLTKQFILGKVPVKPPTKELR